MAYDIVQKPSFYNDLFAIPRDVQRRITGAVRRITTDPLGGGGNSTRCLKHLYSNLYRYRIGDYRLLYAVGDRCVSLLAIGHRNDIYNRFHASESDLSPGPVDASSAELRVIPTTAYDTMTSVDKAINEVSPTSDLDDDDVTAEEPPMAKTPRLLMDLLDVWGVDEEYHEAILRCRSVDELLDLELPDDVKEKLLHWHEPPTIDRIIEQPTMALDNVEDLNRYMEGSLKRFLLKLDPEQERVAARTLRGPTLVKGGPGTGKSLVALYRLKNLLEAPEQTRLFTLERPRILFVTYTRALINVSEELLTELLGEIPAELHVMTLDSKVRELIEQSGRWFRPASPRDELAVLTELLEELQAGEGSVQPTVLHDKVAALRPEYLLEEFNWVIEGRGLNSIQEYLEEDRTGRGIRFDRVTRTAVWTLHELYLRKLQEREQSTWNLYREQALRIARELDDSERYDVVIIDEAQDLTPVALRVCVELCKDPSGLYMTADASQSIYSRGFSWQRVHDDLNVRGRTTILRRNYRMTKQIGEAAVRVLRDHGGGDAEVLENNAVHWGPKPVLLQCRDEGGEIRAIADFLRESARELGMPVSNGAVLVRTNRYAISVADGLNALGVPAQHMVSSQVTLDTDRVRVMTIHAAKGLEFPFVAIAHVNDGLFPILPRGIDEEERDERLAHERRLLFVALSRAMRRLMLTYMESSPSRFVDELDTSLWSVGSYGVSDRVG